MITTPVKTCNIRDLEFIGYKSLHYKSLQKWFSKKMMIFQKKMMISKNADLNKKL